MLLSLTTYSEVQPRCLPPREAPSRIPITLLRTYSNEAAGAAARVPLSPISFPWGERYRSESPTLSLLTTTSFFENARHVDTTYLVLHGIYLTFIIYIIVSQTITLYSLLRDLYNVPHNSCLSLLFLREYITSCENQGDFFTMYQLGMV